MGKENDQSFMRMFMGFSNGDSIGKTKGGQKAFVRSKVSLKEVMSGNGIAARIELRSCLAVCRVTD